MRNVPYEFYELNESHEFYGRSPPLYDRLCKSVSVCGQFTSLGVLVVNLELLDLGTLAYQPAWDQQLAVHEQVLANPDHPGVIILVEHPPVITVGRRANATQNLLAPPALLATRGIELVETDRGGDITFHGPGQLVAYPILNLNTYDLNLHAYMRFLEEVVIATLAQFQITAFRDPNPNPATGVWVNVSAESKVLSAEPPIETQHSALSTQHLSKICALGVKLRRWVTLHGLALNVTTDLSYFNLINPCGLFRPVTTMQKLLGEKTPPMPAVKSALTHSFRTHLPVH